MARPKTSTKTSKQAGFISRTYRFDQALTPAGWRADVCVHVDTDGMIVDISDGPDSEEGAGSKVEYLPGIAIPGMSNLHSHAFQRGFAGLTEMKDGGKEDNFWSWREAMYRFAGALDPESLEAITAQAYVEMLKSGYTSVAEFHYLHHGPAKNGQSRHYDDIAETSRSVLRAAHDTGIGLTHLPVLYQQAAMDADAVDGIQARFKCTNDDYFRLIEALRPAFVAKNSINGTKCLGIALHSLRAVPVTAIKEVLAAKIDPVAVHIHAAEQRKEVLECMQHLGARPVRWLLDNLDIGERWCLIHATHLDDGERRDLAATGAVAGLCPTTEANLGDGIFPAPEYLADGGLFGIGSDSNVSIDPREELRLLEYAQRLTREHRNVLASDDMADTGANLYVKAAAGGAQALGQPVGELASGRRADIVVLDPNHPALIGRVGDNLLNAHVFTGGPSAVSDVMTSGKWVVRDGHHEREEEILAKYAGAIRTIGTAL